MSKYQPHEQRVITERDELKDKHAKLDIFMHTQLFESLPDEDRELLTAQRGVMAEYVDILEQRIARFGGAE